MKRPQYPYIYFLYYFVNIIDLARARRQDLFEIIFTYKSKGLFGNYIFKNRFLFLKKNVFNN